MLLPELAGARSPSGASPAEPEVPSWPGGHFAPLPSSLPTRPLFKRPFRDTPRLSPSPAAVRTWLGRMAGSLVLGALLGGAATYCTLPRGITGSASPCAAAAAAAAADSTSPWWDMGAGGGAGEPGGGSEQGFGDRLNKALSAARVGEAAAQQVLLVRREA